MKSLFIYSQYVKSILVVLFPAALTYAVTLSFDIGAGASFSTIASDSLMAYVLEPTSPCESRKSPSGEFAMEIGFTKFLSIGAGARYLKIGQATPEDTVFFSYNQFPHVLESRIELTYISMPIVAKSGIRSERGWLSMRIGVVPAALWRDRVIWQLDGVVLEPGTYPMQSIYVEDYDISLVGGIESGVNFGRFGVFGRADYQHGIKDIAGGVSGTAKTRVVVILVGVRIRILQ